ncbi:hypothetical protein L2E82_10473 [Cichorium intybus]|uniref:Uncharacterized protein n=1 Tax=Cichorium intybus TaxID=13427 RepID=A0ACB9GCN6_CICIN|nr:hypothetical protein L2E82_10473 [Cichorium intybus]
MKTSFPPSSAEFQEPTSDYIIKPLLDYLIETNILFAAMVVVGHENILVVVAKTGWLCFDLSNAVKARDVYSKMYLQGLVNHLRLGKWMPLRKEGSAVVVVVLVGVELPSHPGWCSKSIG